MRENYNEELSIIMKCSYSFVIEISFQMFSVPQRSVKSIKETRIILLPKFKTKRSTGLHIKGVIKAPHVPYTHLNFELNLYPTIFYL